MKNKEQFENLLYSRETGFKQLISKKKGEYRVRIFKNKTLLAEKKITLAGASYRFTEDV